MRVPVVQKVMCIRDIWSDISSSSVVIREDFAVLIVLTEATIRSICRDIFWDGIREKVLSFLSVNHDEFSYSPHHEWSCKNIFLLDKQHFCFSSLVDIFLNSIALKMSFYLFIDVILILTYWKKIIFSKQFQYKKNIILLWI